MKKDEKCKNAETELTLEEQLKKAKKEAATAKGQATKAKKAAAKAQEDLDIKNVELEETQDELDEAKSKNRGKFWKGLATGAICGGLVVGLAFGLHSCSTDLTRTGANTVVTESQIEETAKEDKTADLVIVPAETTEETKTESEKEETKETESKEESAEEKEEASDIAAEMAANSNVPQTQNYGDVKDDELVYERAKELQQKLESTITVDNDGMVWGIYNLDTGLPYTTEELADIIRYINGGYVPENEADAYEMVNKFYSFVCAPLNTREFIAMVNYQGGDDTFKADIEQYATVYANKENRVDFNSYLLLGDSSTKPFLDWLQDQYYNMLCETDRDKCNEIYNNVMQKLAEFSFGDGCEIDGKVYKEETEIVSQNNINSGNIAQFWVLVIEPFRTAKASNEYLVTSYEAGEASEKEDNVIPYLQITEWWNAICSEEDYHFGEGNGEQYKYNVGNNGYVIADDDEGLGLIDQQGTNDPNGGYDDPQDGYNIAYIIQVNTVDKMAENLLAKQNGHSLTK